LHEYIAFASLRSGPRIQWLNISRELPARVLSFSTEAVHILLSQTAWQMGPLSLGKWEWHATLETPDFGLVLLAELEDLFTSIKANWLEVLSMRTIILLTTRLLETTNDTDIINRAYSLLRNTRDVTWGWTHQLVKQLQENKDECQVQAFQLRVCEMAATCRGSYDVGLNHLPALVSSAEDICVLVESAILVHDNTPLTLESASLITRQLLHRDQWLAHRLEPLLHQEILQSRKGLDDAIVAIWSGYQPGDPWQALPVPNERWLMTQTAVKANQLAQCVHLNLLEGRLLVDGKPVGHLPTHMTKDPLYIRIFGPVSSPLILYYSNSEFIFRGFWMSFLQNFQGWILQLTTTFVATRFAPS
jgi:hypothetical protein